MEKNEAEIIPNEPDAGNAAAGTVIRNILSDVATLR